MRLEHQLGKVARFTQQAPACKRNVVPPIFCLWQKSEQLSIGTGEQVIISLTCAQWQPVQRLKGIAEWGYLCTNPGDGVKLPSRKKPKVEWLEPDKVKELARAIKGSAMEGPVRTILGLGLRRSEMANLEWADVNFDAGIVRVRGTKTVNAYREVPLPKTLECYFNGLESSESVPNVLLNTDGLPWNKDSLNSSLRRFGSVNHLSFKWNFQILRATYGSFLVQKGIPISHVSMVMGHADVRTTQNWYIGLNSTHVSPQIAKVIGQIL